VSLLNLNVTVVVIRFFVKCLSAFCHIFERLNRYIPKVICSYYTKITNFNTNIIWQISQFFLL